MLTTRPWLVLLKENQKILILTEEVNNIQDEVEHYSRLVECQLAEDKLETERMQMCYEDCYATFIKSYKQKEDSETSQNDVENIKIKAFNHIPIQCLKACVCQLCNNALAQQMPDLFQIIEPQTKIDKAKINDMSRQVCTCVIF